MGYPRQEYWSGLAISSPGDLPDPGTEPSLSHLGNPEVCAAAAAKSLQSCPTLRPHRRQPTRLPRPWDSPGKNTGVGCHCLLQCMKVKSESEVALSCLTPSDPMDCSLPGSSVHGIFQARALEWGATAFSTKVCEVRLKIEQLKTQCLWMFLRGMVGFGEHFNCKFFYSLEHWITAFTTFHVYV